MNEHRRKERRAPHLPHEGRVTEGDQASAYSSL